MDPPEGLTYPALRRQLLVVRGRLAVRAAVRAVPLDPRLTVFLAAAAATLLLLAAVAALDVPPAVGVPLVVAGFLAVQSAGFFLVGGPPDDLLAARRDELEDALPGAKRLWEEEKERARAEREAARTAAAPAEPVAPVPAGAPAAVVELVPAVEPPPGDWLHGDGSFSLQIVGESYHQRVLEEICTGLTWVGEDRIVPAVLRLEDSPYDRYAVAVVIAGRKVGHLSRADARAFRLRVAGEGRVGPEFPCRANIHTRPDGHPRGRGHYGVRLDVCLYR